MQKTLTYNRRGNMPDSEQEQPYEGTKEMLRCTILEDREKLQEMITRMWDELPERKSRKK